MKIISVTFFYLGILSLIGSVPGLAQSEPTDVTIGKRFIIKSAVLGEDRAIRIYTTRLYENDRDSFPTVPVLYLLDGGIHDLHAVGLVEFLSYAARSIPPLIVVAIEQKDRFREFSPTRSLIDLNGKPSVRMETTGDAPIFFEFLRQEVIPFVESRYRTAPFRILAGHSFGGLFTTYVLFEHPEAFQACVASCPSVWFDDRAILKRPGPIGRAGQFLFFSVSTEAEAGQRAIRELDTVLRERATPGLVWEFRSYAAETHDSAYHPVLSDALRFLYPDWNFARSKAFKTSATYDGAVNHHKVLSQRYGYEIPVSLATISSVAVELEAQARSDESIALLEKFVAQHPQSSPAQAVLAAAHWRRGDRAAAIKHYERAAVLAPDNLQVKRALDRLRGGEKKP